MKHFPLASAVFTLSALALQSEQQLLAGHSEVFRPDSITLCIITEAGDTLQFIDSDPMAAPIDYQMFHLIDFLPEQNIWVLEIHGYEWMEWQLVNGFSGNVQQTIAAPIPSPDGTRLLCMKEDIDAGFIFNGIQIWRLENDSPHLEFEDIDVPWGPINGRWQTNASITFQKLTYDYVEYRYETRPGKISMDENGSWQPGMPEDWEF